jgi:hypothetical protein
MKFFLTFTALAFSSLTAFAQSSGITAYGFVDAYSSISLFDTKSTSLNYHTNHREAGQVALNIAAAGVSFLFDNTRGDFALMAGNYARNNFVSKRFGMLNNALLEYYTPNEPAGFDHVFQAWAGMKLNSTLWIDAGIFESFIGNESVRGLPNLTHTRSLAAELTPYYLSGLRVVWDQPAKNKTESFYLLNGYQRMVVRENRPNPGFGFNRVQRFNGGNAFVFNAVFVQQSGSGSDGGYADGPFHNLLLLDVHSVYKLSESLEIRPLLDVFFTTTDTKFNGSREKPEISTNVVVQKTLSSKWFLAGRVEAAINMSRQPGWTMELSPNERNSIFGAGLSLGYKPSENSIFRIEGRYLYSDGFAATAAQNPLSITAGFQVGW